MNLELKARGVMLEVGSWHKVCRKTKETGNTTDDFSAFSLIAEKQTRVAPDDRVPNQDASLPFGRE